MCLFSTPLWDPVASASPCPSNLRYANSLRCKAIASPFSLAVETNESTFVYKDFDFYDVEKKKAVLKDNYKKYMPSIFIPAKEMLSHSKGLLAMSEKYSRDMPFDNTLLDIIKKAQAWKPDIPPELAVNIVPKLEKIIDGVVFMKNDNSFWVRKYCGLEIPFIMEAEGLRKFALLWQLLMNEGITNDTIMFWDEPEANLNPQLYSLLVDVLLTLSRSGIQMFLATHSYDLVKFFEVKKKQVDSVLIHSLYKSGEGVKCETSDTYKGLKNNAIETGANELYNAIVSQDIEVLFSG